MENTRLDAVNKSFVQTIVAFLFLLAMIGSCHGQQDKLHRDKSKNPSPRASASCSFSDGKTVRTEYFRPGVKGRKIFGALVPYGQKWFFGADSAPTLITDADLTVGGQDAPAGNYTLSAIPNPDKWTLIISKETSNQGKGEDEDPLRVEMKISKTPDIVENLTIAYEPKDGRCTLRMSWENTQAWVDVAEKRLCWPTTSPLTYQCPD